MPIDPQLRPPMIRSGDYLRFYAERERRAGRTVTCVQVGANDGLDSDPVNEYLTLWGWKGLLAEPLPDVYAQLTRTYQGRNNVQIANLAIGATPGELPFYRIGGTAASWATGLSSFNRQHVQDHIDRGYVAKRAREAGQVLPDEGLIETIDVRTVTFEQFLAQHGVDDFDVLVVDTEGFDLQVLKLVDFARHKPDVVLFESDNLSDSDYRSALALLYGHGYELRWSFLDTMALRVSYPRRAAVRALLRDPKRIQNKVARLAASWRKGRD